MGFVFDVRHLVLIPLIGIMGLTRAINSRPVKQIVGKERGLFIISKRLTGIDRIQIKGPEKILRMHTIKSDKYTIFVFLYVIAFTAFSSALLFSAEFPQISVT